MTSPHTLVYIQVCEVYKQREAHDFDHNFVRYNHEKQIQQANKQSKKHEPYTDRPIRVI